ncbi:protein of unknown function [Georgfuchsia toluolica]|uniref:Uncharacterized protein n=1 Tax=Georgfuchsia toluolica TaxID=424218 RepID=A0A916N1X9_9PROT|nr:hypothetical protein [Georgfuchsia toluolica]CAG4883194.1 protein of unknown function [Georgfuchsia toluolica]
MTLTLVIPGLLWPRQVMQDTLYDTDFPALQTLLGKGRWLASTAASAEAWWCAHFGIGLDEFAAAPLRLHALGKEAGDSTWLCADPVHLEADRHGATLKDPAALHITAEEAAQLHALLAPLFAAVGELVVATPSQWHLRLTTPAPALPAHLYDLVGQSAAASLPQGDSGRRWRQLLNEVQMSLHAHPVNTERELRGQAEINSIALWGGGRLPKLTMVTSATPEDENTQRPMSCPPPQACSMARFAQLARLGGAKQCFANSRLNPRGGVSKQLATLDSHTRLRFRFFTLKEKKPSALWSDDPVVAGAARLAGLQVGPLPVRFTGTEAAGIVHWHRLQAPAASHDAQAWREGLQQLDQDWLAPALTALASGKLKRIELHGFGDESAVSLSMAALDRYRFWRKPRRLETM